MIQENMCCHIRICKSMTVSFVADADICYALCVRLSSHSLSLSLNVVIVDNFAVVVYWCRQALLSPIYPYCYVRVCNCVPLIWTFIFLVSSHFISCSYFFRPFVRSFAWSLSHSNCSLHLVGCLKNEIYDYFMAVVVFFSSAKTFLSYTILYIEIYLVILAVVKRYILPMALEFMDFTAHKHTAIE